MYGFQPKHARGKPAQALADGGLVHSITGMLGMRKKTPEEMLAADAKVQERNREAAARVAARAKPAQPVAPAEEKAVSNYAGMSAMQRREQAAGLKDGGTVGGFKPGGLIRGPGTGTSDSIKTEKRPGTFIMPADSTQAIGPEALQSLGAPKGMPEAEGMEEPGDMDDRDEPEGEKVPVRLSNGEFELPPEQVQALGEAVLTVMRNATHQPASGKEAPTNKGFTPHQFFSGGGTVKDKEQQRLANQTAMYVRGAQEAAANRPPEPAAPKPAAPAAEPQAAFGVFPQLGRNSAGAPAQTAAPQAAAPVPATQVEGWRTKAVMDGAAEDAQAAWDRGGVEGVAGAAGAVARGAITAVPTAIGEFAYNTVAPLGGVARGFWNGVTGGGSPETTAGPAAPTPAAPRPAAEANPTDQRIAAGAQQAPASATAPTATATAPTTQPASAMVAPGAYRNAPGQYSDNASGMGFTSVPGSGGQGSPVGKTVEQAQREGLIGERVGYNPAYDQRLNGATGISAQNMAAADALAARQTPAGFQPAGSQPAGVQAPVVRNSTNDWAARKALANAETAASSITNTRRWGGKGAESSPDVQAYQAMLKNDMALQLAQPGMDKAAMDANAALQRESTQQAGANQRTAMQEQGANTRDAGRNALTAEELGLRREAQGFQTRAAAQQEQLRNTLIDPKATPEQRKQAQEYLQALAISGKEPSPQYKSHVMPAIRNADGSTTEGSVYQENTRTGEGRWVKPQGDGQPALPPGMKRQIGTSNGRPVYEDMNGKQVIAKG